MVKTPQLGFLSPKGVFREKMDLDKNNSRVRTAGAQPGINFRHGISNAFIRSLIPSFRVGRQSFERNPAAHPGRVRIVLEKSSGQCFYENIFSCLFRKEGIVTGDDHMSVWERRRDLAQ